MEEKSLINVSLPGLPTILFLIFLILKLTDNIDWSWWWVTAPLWIPASIFCAVVVFILFIMLAIYIIGR